MTDHRAQVEDLLQEAIRSLEEHDDLHNRHTGTDPIWSTIACALIGIGHALLAQTEPEPIYDGENDPFNRTMPRVDTNTPTYRVGAHEFTNPEYARMEEYAQGIGLGAYRPLHHPGTHDPDQPDHR